jgi:hypothetical protein
MTTRPREDPRNSAAIAVVFPAGALGFTGELAAALWGTLARISRHLVFGRGSVIGEKIGIVFFTG